MKVYLTKLTSIFTVVAASGCFAGAPTLVGCRESSDCDSGWACQEGECVQLCETQEHCPSNEVCSAGGLCVEPAEGEPPAITEVFGNGEGGRVLNGMVVTGEFLGTAAFELRSDGPALPLTTRSQRDQRVHVAFPVDIRSGTYTLVATNQAGADQAPIELLLPEVTGQQVLDKLNNDAVTGQLDPALIPAVADGSITPEKLSETYAGAATMGGPAADLLCTDCVSNGEVEFPYARSSHKAGPASDLDCAGCVMTGDIQNGTITAADIGANAVGNSELADGAVTGDKLDLKAFRAYRSTSQSITSTSFTKVQLTLEDYDFGDHFNPSSNRWTAPYDCLVHFSGAVELDEVNGYHIASLYKNGVEVARGTRVTPVGGDSTAVVSTDLQLAIGDYVELYTTHSHGSARTVQSGSARTYLSGHEILRL